MRLIGTLPDERQARLLTAWMLAEGMDAVAEPAGEEYEIWIRHEDQVEVARRELEQFRQAPDAPRYSAAVQRAAEVERERRRKHQAIQKNVVRGPRAIPGGRKSPLVVLLLVLSGLVALMTNFGYGNFAEQPAFQSLTFNWTTGEQAAALHERFAGDGDALQVRTASLQRGELWRIFTPMFLHFGTTHLVFNLLMLFQLGRIIEWRYGTFWLAALVLYTAACAHLAEGLVPGALKSAPVLFTPELVASAFGGMSGVVYGLFGFVWIKSVYDPASRFVLQPGTIVIMVVWLLLCMTPVFESLTGTRVANWAHGAGLVSGMLAALASLGSGSKS